MRGVLYLDVCRLKIVKGKYYKFKQMEFIY